MATRTYTSGDRTFDIALAGPPAERDSSWTVQHVFDRSINQEICVRGMESIMAPTEEAAFSCVCKCIDESLRSKPLTSGPAGVG